MERKFDNGQFWAEINTLHPLSVSMSGLVKAIESARAYGEQARLLEESQRFEKEHSDEWENLRSYVAQARVREQIVMEVLNQLFPDREYEEIPTRPIDEYFDYH